MAVITTFASPEEFSGCLDAARGGCAESLGRLLNDRGPYLQAVLDRRLGPTLSDHDSAGDLVQETFMRALRGFAGFRGTTEGALCLWLRQILLNLLPKYYAARAQRPAALRPGHEPGDVGAATCVALSEQDTDTVRQVMEQLTDEEREILALRIQEHWPWEVIGDHLGKSPDAARMVYTRILDRLRHPVA